MTRHLLGIDGMTRADVERLLELSEHFLEVTRRDIPKVPALRGKVVVSLFYEDSTRTRISFETAAKRLSCDVMSFSVGSSSVQKGESLRDTVQTIEAMGIDALVLRHSSAGAPALVATWVDASVLNAGDGCHEHPTQALLDALTLRRHVGPALDGLRLAIVGDILHSRVARSDVLAFAALGAEVTLVAPPTLMPFGVETWPCQTSYDLDAALSKADAVMMLRVQRERMNAAFFPTQREYTRRYGLDARRLALMPERALVMHPGPMVRGMEIESTIADSDRAVIVEQVANGVSVRMAVLYLLLGGSEPAITTSSANTSEETGK